MSIASPLEQAMLKLINAERAAAGVGALRFDDNLNDAAEDHSQDMLVTNIFAHEGADGSTPRARMIEAGYRFEGANASGENIGFQSERGAPGILDDVEDIHDSLMASPGHRANILSANFDEIGIGIVEGPFTSDGATFNAIMVTQNFATTQAPEEPVVVTPPQPDVPVVVTPTEDEELIEEPTGPVVEEPDVAELEEPQDDEPLEEPTVPEPEEPHDEEQPQDDDEPADPLGKIEEPQEEDDTDFEFKDDETPTLKEEPEDVTPYVWTKTHSDETYAKIIDDFTVSCTEEAFATLDQELKAFVLREFECDFDIV